MYPFIHVLNSSINSITCVFVLLRWFVSRFNFRCIMTAVRHCTVYVSLMYMDDMNETFLIENYTAVIESCTHGLVDCSSCIRFIRLLISRLCIL